MTETVAVDNATLQERASHLYEPGKYRHFKGKLYEVMLTAIDASSSQGPEWERKDGSLVVIYRSEEALLAGESAVTLHRYFSRPIEEFLSDVLVERDGVLVSVPRFERVP